MGAQVLDVVTVELEEFLRQIFEPDIQITSYPVRSGSMSPWGAVEIGSSHSKCQICTKYDDKWSYCPRYPREGPQPLSFDFQITGDGVVVQDVITCQYITHTLDNPEVFNQILDHIFYNIDFLLREVQVRFEWVISQQGIDPDFDEYGDVSGHLAVLREKRKLFNERYRSVEL